MDKIKKMIGGVIPKFSGPAASNRAMKFPYTFTAKIVQFPYLFYIKHSWIYRYYCYGIILSIPVFVKIHTMANSEGNVKKWEEEKRKEREMEALEHDH